MILETDRFTTRAVTVESRIPEWNNIPAEVQNIVLKIAEWGNPGAAPADTFIMAHGITGNFHYWTALARQMLAEASRPVRIIALDLRGRGDSDKPEQGPYHVASHSADIAGLLDKLGFKEPVNFVGHSLGAHIGAYFASHYPDRVNRLVLIDGGGRMSADVLQSIQVSLGRLGRVFARYEDYIANLKGLGVFPEWNAEVDGIFNYDTRPVEGGVMSKINKSTIDLELEQAEQFYNSVEGYYPRIQAATLVCRAPKPITPQLSPFLQPEVVASMQKNITGEVRVIEVPGANHYSIASHPSLEMVQAILNG